MQSTGLNFAGATVGYIAMRKAPEKVQKFAGPVVLIIGLLAQLSSNKYVQESGSGAALVGAFETVNTYLPEAVKEKTNGLLPTLAGTPYALGQGLTADLQDEFDDPDDDDYEDDSNLLGLGMDDEDLEDEAASFMGFGSFGGLGEAEEMMIAQAML